MHTITCPLPNLHPHRHPCISTDALVIDGPYGRKVAVWDQEQMTADDYKRNIVDFRNMRINPFAPHTIFICHEPHMFQTFKPVLDEMGFNNGQMFYIYQKEKNQKGLNCFIPAVITVYVAHYPKSQGPPPRVEMVLNRNPVLRHNIIGADPIGLDRVKLSDGKTSANSTQKPIVAFASLFATVVPPGQTLVVPYAGSGALMSAAIMARLNVVGFEREQQQFDAACARFLEIQKNFDDFMMRPKNISLCCADGCERAPSSLLGDKGQQSIAEFMTDRSNESGSGSSSSSSSSAHASRKRKKGGDCTRGTNTMCACSECLPNNPPAPPAPAASKSSLRSSPRKKQKLGAKK
jgi:hypothetical protein